MLRSILGPILAALALAGSAAAADAPVLSRIAESRELRVGMSGDQPPLNMKSKSGEIIGFEPDVATLLARAMQVELKIVVKPFAELLAALTSGEVDVVMSNVTITPERNLQAAFVGPYFVSGKSILTRSEKLARIDDTTPINAPEVKLTALAGSTSQKFVEMLVPKAKLVTTADTAAGIELVLQDKVDAMVADYPTCLYAVARHSGRGLTTLLSPLTIEPIGIALPPNDALFMNLIENYLAALRATGVLDALRKKWMEDAAWLQELP
jgi:polar amino acid transport system substrate-binding protein